MTTVTDIDSALRAALPPDLHGPIRALAGLLADTACGLVSPADAQVYLASQPALRPPLEALAGQEISAGRALLSFGEGSDLGDVGIRDVAGGNIVNLNVSLTISGATPQIPVTTSMLPPIRWPVADFVGRDQEIETLASELRAGLGRGAIAIISGTGGMGKTELALAVAQRLAPQFPDGQLLLELRGTGDPPLTAEQALLQVIQHFEPQVQVPDDTSMLDGRYRSLLNGKRILIVADDALGREQVLRLEPPEGCTLLITSRNHFVLPRTHPHDLSSITPTDAETLLLAICPRIADAAGQLAKLCGYMPLALRVSASLLASDPTREVDTYLAALANIRTRLQQLYDPESRDLNVAATLDLSYSALDAYAQTALRQLTIFTTHFDLEAAKAVVKLTDVKSSTPVGNNQGRQKGRAVPPALEEILRTLYRRSLLAYDQSEYRYGLHDVIRAFAIIRLTPREESRQWRYARHYAGAATMAEALYQKGGENILEGLALFDRERVHIDAGWRWAEERANDELLLTYAKVIGYVGFLRYHPRRERIPLAEAALAAARRLRRHKDEASALNNLGNAYLNLGNFRQAAENFEQARTIMRTLQDQLNEGVTLQGLGNAYRQMGLYKQATTTIRRVLDIGQANRNQRLKTAALNGLGRICSAQSEIRRALSYYEQAITISREIGDRSGESEALRGLGSAYQMLGDMRRALSYCEQALTISREIGDRGGENEALRGLGSAYQMLGDMRRALSYCERALPISCEIGDRSGESSALVGLGSAYRALGALRQALSYYEQALTISREIGGRSLESDALGNMGWIWFDLGEPDRAVELCMQALTIKRETGDHIGEGYALSLLGKAHAANNEDPLARKHYEQALSIAREFEERYLQARTLNDLGELLFAQDQQEAALEHLEQARALAHEIEAREIEVLSCWNIGLILESQGHLARAAELMQLRVDYEREIGHARAEQRAAELAALRERVEEAVDAS